MKNKNSPTALICFVFLLFLLVGSFIHYKKTLSQPISESDERITIVIEEGQSVKSILNSLVEEGLLKNLHAYYVKIYLKLNKLESKLQAGTYQLPKQLTIVELVEALQSGRDLDIWVLIPEGLRKDEIANIIKKEFDKNNLQDFSREGFLQLTEDKEYINTLDLTIEVDNLEGFLFPDRYAFPKDATAETVIERMVSNFKTKVGEEYTYEEIIFASIVEREGYNASDRPIIAGIILKRYSEGWLLQTDATLLYPVKNWKHTITVQDKEDDNPYNTYKRLGLPPTPICNPGLQSIEAVWKPQESSYYFYIHDKEKNPHFAGTLDEHKKNIEKYLR